MFPDIQGVKNGNIGLACIKLLISVKVLSGLLLVQPKAYLELCQKSKMKCFVIFLYPPAVWFIKIPLNSSMFVNFHIQGVVYTLILTSFIFDCKVTNKCDKVFKWILRKWILWKIAFKKFEVMWPA